LNSPIGAEGPTNGALAMTFITAMSTLPPEYFSQRPDLAAGAVFRAYWPCR
jgi:hypothetical protein